MVRHAFFLPFPFAIFFKLSWSQIPGLVFFIHLLLFLSVRSGFRHSLDQITDTDTKGRTESLFVESRSAGFGDEVKRRILLGTYALSARSAKSSISSFFDRLLFGREERSAIADTAIGHPS